MARRFIIYALIIAAPLLCTITAKRAGLPLPSIPSTITAPQERAAYLLEHYWDRCDFADTTLVADRALMEQSFATFISVFPHTTEEARITAVRRLVERAATSPQALHEVIRMAEKYLYNTTSPMLDEGAYLLFLRAFTASHAVADREKGRMRFLMGEIAKNLPGRRAADFPFTALDGTATTLYGEMRSGAETLLILYDADCAHCDEVLGETKKDSALAAKVAEGSLVVVAVCIEGTPEQWREHAKTLPPTWTIGHAAEAFRASAPYYIRTFPTLLWIDTEGKIAGRRL